VFGERKNKMNEKDYPGNGKNNPLKNNENDRADHDKEDSFGHKEDDLPEKEENDIEEEEEEGEDDDFEEYEDYEEEDDLEDEDEIEEQKEKPEKEEAKQEQEKEPEPEVQVGVREKEKKQEKEVKEIKEFKEQGKTKDKEREIELVETFDLKKEAEKAERKIRKHIRETPLEYSPFFSQTGHSEVHLKLENMQLTGSFKLRGTMNKLLSLSKKERRTILVTASSGNHGTAFAYAVKKMGLRGIIYLPGHAPKVKVEAMKYYDVVLKFFGTDCVNTEEHAIREALKNNFKYIPPYNDLKIIGGQGTIGIELKKQLEKIDAVLVPVGGGGLISGIAGYLKSLDENIEIIGCLPENSPVMYESIKAGKIIEMESKPTISDGSAGGIEQGSITFDICKKYVNDFILVSEKEIKEAMKVVLEKHFMLIEGAGALSVACFMKAKERFKGKTVVLILSGSKISLEKLKEVISSEDKE
jgi:threonine dehydratase